MWEAEAVSPICMAIRLAHGACTVPLTTRLHLCIRLKSDGRWTVHHFGDGEGQRAGGCPDQV